MSPERKVKPLKPEEVFDRKLEDIPDAVLEAFNELIARGSGGHQNYSVVRQTEVVELIVSKGIDRKEIFEKGWLDIEEIYRRYGWSVMYDKPGYNETYEPTFTFRRVKHSGGFRDLS